VISRMKIINDIYALSLDASRLRMPWMIEFVDWQYQARAPDRTGPSRTPKLPRRNVVSFGQGELAASFSGVGRIAKP